MTAVKVALSFVGLIVGAGFATGQKMIQQYFTSFGAVGIWGAVISGLLVAAAGSVTFTLFSVGFVMIAAGPLPAQRRGPAGRITDAAAVMGGVVYLMIFNTVIGLF